MLKRLIKLGAAGVFVVAGGAVAAPPAEAATSAYVCASNQLCFYENESFTGSAFVVNIPTFLINGAEYLHVDDANRAFYTNGDSLDNSISSYLNSEPLALTLCTGTNLTGNCTVSVPYYSARGVGSFYNDQISSLSAVAREQ